MQKSVEIDVLVIFRFLLVHKRFNGLGPSLIINNGASMKSS